MRNEIRRRATGALLALAVALALALALGGCATVQPWERERLARPAMQFAVDPDADEQEASILEITEGATYGSGGSAGAGCGCH